MVVTPLFVEMKKLIMTIECITPIDLIINLQCVGKVKLIMTFERV